MLAGALVTSNAAAVPVLQLYIQGATYDPVEQSWYYPGHDFTLWAIGNLTGPGGTGGLAITNVRLAVVYDDPGTPVTITFTPTSGSYMGFSDPSVPAAPTWLGTETDGSTPWIVGNKYVPNHGEYGAGRTWQEFSLGDFTTPDSQLGNFVDSFPAPGGPLDAQINAYTVHVDGADAHFDLYAQYQTERGQIHHLVAPGSHDATDGPDTRTVPLPATWALLGIGALALGAIRRKSR
jgi:hypothetical protein